MTTRNTGLTAETLFVGATRPPMRWGVTYSALMLNLVLTMEIFVLTKNLLTLLIALPVHGLSALLCVRDARIFDLLLLWARTGIPSRLTTFRLWSASTYTPLVLDFPNRTGRRRVFLSGGSLHIAKSARP